MSLFEGLAVWGAVVGTLGAVWQIRNWWLDRPLVRVETSAAILTSPWLIHVSITAVNTGRQSAQLEECGFELEENYHLVYMGSPALMPGVQLPHELASGRKAVAYFNAGELAVDLAKNNRSQSPRRAYFRDATGRTYTRRVKANVFQSWLRRAQEQLERESS